MTTHDVYRWHDPIRAKEVRRLPAHSEQSSGSIKAADGLCVGPSHYAARKDPCPAEHYRRDRQHAGHTMQ
jgi:hypothetical protein